MAAEARRACGYRKIGGTYLAADGPSFPCGRFPLALLPCPLCDHRPAFVRSLQRITPKSVLHASPVCKLGDEARCAVCPLGRALDVEVAGLLWVGEKFYPSPAAFAAEARKLGVSKRIPGHIPRWFEVGKTWVFFAHPHGLGEPCGVCTTNRALQATGTPWDPTTCEECDGRETLEHPGLGTVWVPAVFYACRPARLERIVADTMPEADREKLRAQGFTVVPLPANDPDHRGRDDGE
jgi:hypothetical protein